MRFIFKTSYDQDIDLAKHGFAVHGGDQAGRGARWYVRQSLATSCKN